MALKQKTYLHCIELLKAKIRALELILHELSESASNNTKSSAGDKHETARAMVQIEQETIGKQLNDVLEQKQQLEKIDLDLSSSQIIKGSLVKTDKGYLFISIALGKVNFEEHRVMAISPQSPLGVKLMGFQANDTVEINRIKYFIESVC